MCEACLGNLHPLTGTLCQICGEALISPVFLDQAEPRCGLCERAHPPFEKAVAYGSYDGGLRDLIHLLKFQQIRPAAGVLGTMLAEAIISIESALPTGPIAVVPVPLHRRKKAQRGFNQSELIARAALKHLARPERFEIVAGVLIRRRETGSQIGLTRHQRRENLRGAFKVSEPHPIAGRDVLLVDDVYTTGTTVAECSKVLRRAGARRVYVATVGRTLKIFEGLPVSEDNSDKSAAVSVPVAANF